MRDKPRWEIIHGDSLKVLESFPPGTFDAVITDPPYASGGRTQAEKSKATNKEIPMVMIVRLKKVKRDSLK